MELAVRKVQERQYIFGLPEQGDPIVIGWMDTQGFVLTEACLRVDWVRLQALISQIGRAAGWGRGAGR